MKQTEHEIVSHEFAPIFNERSRVLKMCIRDRQDALQEKLMTKCWGIWCWQK